jgi:hypothetical protein
MNYGQAIKDLQDNLIVIAEIERRQSALLKEHSEFLVEQEGLLRRHERAIAESEEFRRKTEQNLSEITDKLNGLIGYMDGQHRPPA